MLPTNIRNDIQNSIDCGWCHRIISIDDLSKVIHDMKVEVILKELGYKIINNKGLIKITW